MANIKKAVPVEREENEEPTVEIGKDAVTDEPQKEEPQPKPVPVAVFQLAAGPFPSGLRYMQSFNNEKEAKARLNETQKQGGAFLILPYYRVEVK